MNDDFLHGIRVEPPAGFMARLKARLDLQPPPTPPAPRRSMLRVLAFGLLFGGSVFAITLLTVKGVPDFARNLIQSQHQTQPAGTSNNTAKIPANNVPQTPGVTTQLRPAQTTAQAPSTTASTADSASQSGTPAKSQSIGSGRSTPPSLIVGMVTPRALSGYTTSLYNRGRGGLTPSIKETDDTTEALATFCGTSTSALPNAGAIKNEPPPSLAIATRRITRAEFAACTRNIGSIAEVEIGHQVVVLARSKLYGAFALTPSEIFLALAAEIPDPTQPDKLIPNPNKTWSDVNNALEREPIEVLGPDPSSPIGTALREIILQAGCTVSQVAMGQAVTGAKRTENPCTTLRKDGPYIIQIPDQWFESKLQSRPNAIGILSYSSLFRNSDSLVAVPINGVGPTRATIEGGTYPGSRTLFLYVSQDSSTPLTNMFVPAFVSSYGYFPETFAILTPRDVGNTPGMPMKLTDLKL
jgi:hypothetical protein